MDQKRPRIRRRTARALRYGVSALMLGGLCYLTNHYTWDLVAVRNDPIGWLPFALLGVALGISALIGSRDALLALLPLASLLGVIEFGLRLYYVRFAPPEHKMLLATTGLRERDGEIVYQPHHYSLYTPEPGLTREDGLRHNSLGFRDEREFPHNVHSLRIVFLGGSTTYTTRIRDNSKIFTHGLQQRLNVHLHRRLKGDRIQVINAGMGGATSAENLIRLAFLVSEVGPDLVVIQHGVNDVWPRLVGRIRSDYGNYRKRWAAPDTGRLFSVAHGASLSALRRTMLGSFFLNRLGLQEAWHLYAYTNRDDLGRPNRENARHNDARYFARNTRFMIALTRAQNARVLLVTAPTTPRAGIFHELTQEHNAIIRKIAREEQTGFFDLASLVTADDEHYPDGLHVSQAGSDEKSELYFRFLLDSGAIGALIEDPGGEHPAQLATAPRSSQAGEPQQHQ